MAFNVFTNLSSNILGQITAFSGVSGTVIGWVTAPILAALTIQIMWQGFNILRGAGGNMHLIDLFFKSMRAFLVFSLALAGGAYVTNVQGFFTDLRTSLTGLFVAGGGSSYAALDSSMEQAIGALRTITLWSMEHITILSTSPDLSGIVSLISGYVMVICLALYAMVAAVNLLLIDFCLMVIWGIGPLFVACFAFQSTARFTDAWLTAVMKYTFTAVVIAAVVGMGNGILSTYAVGLAGAATGPGVDFLPATIGALGASGILIIMAYKAPELAGNIVGGIGLSVVGPAAAMAPIAAVTAMGANAGAYSAGRIGSSAPGQALANTAVGKSVVHAAQTMGAMGAGIRNFGNAVAGRGVNSQGQTVRGFGAANAYNIGQGAGSGTGTVTGKSFGQDRPLGNSFQPVEPSMPLPKIDPNI